MIIVTGTHRSGTSLWMQILGAAGLPVLGERFPARFAAISDLNPEGFWESRLRTGVNYTSNPDPETGIYLSPEETRGHALKVYVRGLVRSDVAFLDRVLCTVRGWREHSRSMARLIAAEEAPLLQIGTPEALARLERRRASLPQHPAAVEWWFQLHALIADVMTRRYPFHIVTYGRLLRDPGAEVSAALAWIGSGELAPAIAAVRPELRSFDAPEVDAPEGVEADMIEVFDAVYAALDEGRALDAPLVRGMNDVQTRLRARWPS